MTRAAIGLGSNLGDRRVHLRRAVGELAGLGRIEAVSPLYETEPVGGPEQDPYLNAVVVLETDLGPSELLEQLLAIERRAGRERRERWGPRVLDLDLLLYGDREVDREGLTVPHPRLAGRRFVLRPLLDVWPEARLPDGTSLERFLGEVADQEVGRLEDPGWAES